jgi:hypothetical protein
MGLIVKRRKEDPKNAPGMPLGQKPHDVAAHQKMKLPSPIFGRIVISRPRFE